MRGIAATLLVILAVTGAPVVALADVPEPPLVVDAGAEDGQVRLRPPSQAVDGGRVAWVLTNGGDAALRFDLALHELADDGAGGVAVGDPVEPSGLARSQVRLAPGEAVRVPLRVDPDPPRALVLVATSVDADPETTVSGIAMVGGGGPVVPTVTSADPGAGTFVVHLESRGPTLADVALRAVAWPGVPRSATTVEGVYVPAGGRDLEVEVAGTLAGRVTLDVAVGDGVDERTQTAVWWWPPWLLLVLALVVLLLVLAFVARHRRRGRARGLTDA